MSATEDIYAGWSDAGQAFARRIRALIFEVAEEAEAGPLTETLKWGQPSYLTEATKSGTTIRIGYASEDDLPGRMYVHCGTDLLDRYRMQFSDTLTFDGNRAVHLRADLTPEEPLRTCIAMALTYHRNKKAPHG